MTIIEVFIGAFITIMSLGFLILSYFSYNRYKSPKMLVLVIAFFLFFIKGMLYSINLLYENIAFFDSISNILIFDVVILILLYIASLKR